MFSASTKLTEGELRTLSVQVTAPNAEDGDKWMAYVQQIVEGPLHDYVAKQVGAHELRFLTKGSEMRVDTSLLSKIESYSKTITTDQTAYETNKKQVTTDAASGAKKLTRAARIRQILKMAAGGFAVGLLLAAIWYFFRYVFRGVVQDGADLILGYDLAVYGEATASRARKSGKGLDRLIEKWERGGSDTDPTAAWGRIATLVDTNHGEERLLMTGPVSTEALEKAMEGLRPRVHSTKLEKEAEMLTNGRAVTASAEADAVLLVVEKHKTKLAELRRAAEILQINRAKVAGCILV
jgi:hypothetical protein